MKKKIAIIGGGAAGFFTAINLAESRADLDVTLYEGSNKLLAKVLVSGGGRCNVTNRLEDPNLLADKYPRGSDFLLEPFKTFGSKQTKEWFEERNVPLKTEDDGRVFPLSNTSSTIFSCLTQAARSAGVTVELGKRLEKFRHNGDQWDLAFKGVDLTADALVLATGSNPKVYKIIEKNNIEIVAPLPSLFTFNAKNHHFIALAGLSVPSAYTSIKEIKGSIEDGPLLITHWGYSAPSILKLSAWYARELANLNYTFTLVMNWNGYDRKELKALFESYTTARPKDKIYSWKEHDLPKRLWQVLFAEANFKEYTNWSEIGKKGIERLLAKLCCYEVRIEGKSTFKEEFVTAGGIELNQVEHTTFAIKEQPNLYAVGEVLNIDAVTGGFNFQAAWTGGYIAAKAMRHLL